MANDTNPSKMTLADALKALEAAKAEVAAVKAAAQPTAPFLDPKSGCLKVPVVGAMRGGAAHTLAVWDALYQDATIQAMRSFLSDPAFRAKAEAARREANIARKAE